MVGTDPVVRVCLTVPVAVVGEDVAHMPVLAGADLQGQYAGRFQSRLAIAFGQRQQSQASPIAMLWMFAFFEQAGYRDSGSRTDVLPPVNQPLRCPFHVRLVCGRHMFWNGTETAASTIADMAGDALPAMENFDGASGDTRFQYLSDQGMRYAIAMPLYFNVIVDVGLDTLEVGHFIALQWQGQQRWRIERREGAGAAAGEFLEWPLIELFQQWHDRVVDFMHASEWLMPQARHDPAFDDLHCRLHLCFVLGMVRTRRENRGAVMAREVEHRAVAAWLVAIGVRDQRPRIIGNDELGHAAIKTQCACRRLKPIGHRFTGRGAGECVAGGAHRRNEDMGAAAIAQCKGGAGEINEQLLAGAVDLAHRALELLGKAPVVVAELRIAVGLAVRVVCPVFFPQQHQRHALAAQLLMEAAEVRLNMLARFPGRDLQPLLKGNFVTALYCRPVQTRYCGEPHIFGDDTFGNAQHSGNLLV
jgi:hypothetical protein